MRTRPELTVSTKTRGRDRNPQPRLRLNFTPPYKREPFDACTAAPTKRIISCVLIACSSRGDAGQRPGRLRRDMIRLPRADPARPDFATGFCRPHLALGQQPVLVSGPGGWERIHPGRSAQGVRRPAFDHARLAPRCRWPRTPPSIRPSCRFALQVRPGRPAIEVNIGKRYFVCDLEGYTV